jgi:hypothetical protein
VKVAKSYSGKSYILHEILKYTTYQVLGKMQHLVEETRSHELRMEMTHLCTKAVEFWMTAQKAERAFGSK